MVSILTAQQLDAAVALAHRLNIQPQYACKACPQGKKALKDSFQTVLSHPHDRLLGILDGDQLCAVLALMAEPEERYAELVGGVFTEDSALWLPFFDYLRQHYMGVRLDACYPETNKTAIACMQKLGARLIDASDEYLLSSFSEMKPFVAQPVMAGDFAEFSAFHDRLQPGVYWTGARLAVAPV